MSALLALAMQVAAHSSRSRLEMNQARLNAMADACRAPRTWLEMRGREVVFKADPDADFAMIECVLTKLSVAIDTQNIGFIGNALPSDNK